MHTQLERRDDATARIDHAAYLDARERFFAALEAQSALHNLEAAWRSPAFGEPGSHRSSRSHRSSDREAR